MDDLRYFATHHGGSEVSGDTALLKLSHAQALSEIGRATFIEKFGHLHSKDNVACFLKTMHSEEFYKNLLEDRHHHILLVMQGDRPIGYAVVGPSSLPYGNALRDGEIKRLYVIAFLRGRQIGHRLMERCMTWLSVRYTRILLGVYSENKGAQRFYQRFGFEKVGEYDFMVGDQADRDFILLRQV